jgi:hypothetical protein
MKNIDSKKLVEIQGADRSVVAVRQPVRTSPKLAVNLLLLPKPGPVVG